MPKLNLNTSAKKTTKKTTKKTDPKPDSMKKSNAIPSAWGKIKLSSEFREAWTAKGAVGASTYAIDIAAAIASIKEGMLHVSTKTIQAKDMRSFVAYQAAGFALASRFPELKGLKFKAPGKPKKKETSKETATRKAMQIWQKECTTALTAGDMAIRLESLGVELAEAYPAMTISKIMSLYAAWKRAVGTKKYSLGKDVKKCNFLLKKLYTQALKTSERDIRLWGKAPSDSTDSGSLAPDGSVAADQGEGKDGSFKLSYTADGVVKHIQRGAFAYDDMLRIQETVGTFIAKARKAVRK